MTLLAFLSDRCNMTCAYCFLALNQGKATVLSLDVLRRAMEGHEKVTLLGGEPTLHWELIRAVARKGVSLVSNGTLLTKPRLDELKALGVDVCISLDGDAATNDESRKLLSGGSAHDKTLASVTDRGWVRVNMVLTPQNAGRFLQNIEHLRAQGFRRFSFHPDVMGAWTEGTVAALRAALNGFARYKTALGNKIEVSHSSAYAEECEVYTDTVLGADGNVYPCDGLFVRPYSELKRFANRVEEWRARARADIHSWIGPHRTCPREAYFAAVARGEDPRPACERYAAADRALSELMCATT